MSDQHGGKPSGYDKYVNYKYFGIAVAAFVLILILPMPSSIRDVAVEYTAGKPHVLDLYSQELFGKKHADVEQWQATAARALEAHMVQGALTRGVILKRDDKQLAKMGITAPKAHLAELRKLVESMDDARYLALMQRARALRYDQLTYEGLSVQEKVSVDKAASAIQVCLAMVAFVVICFLTEAIPLPGVALCIGLILVFSGMVGREQIAGLFWSDAAWFIMGSLMFAAAFVKTGVDKRIALTMFRYFARPSVKIITAILIIVISPAAAFISDHALAAMFLPIAIALYANSLNEKNPQDPELGKMLVICIAMACNIGGFGSPSGGARNVIIMTYLEDMFGISISYGRWMLFGMPFVLIMMPVLWFFVNLRFKPKVTDMTQALERLKRDIARSGAWTRKQIIAVVIFVVMLLGWILESNVLLELTGIRLGIGVLAIAGAVAYLLTGVVNWRDYQEKVDWGVVWLYAGAIVFGRQLDSSGTAYWMARSVVEGLASLGVDSASALLAVGGVVTTAITNLMADGPAAAAVGPVTLNMAAVANPSSVLIPLMGLVTSCSASFAYLLIIGTPPNAIVYASGYLQPKDFLRVGIPCLLIAFVVMVLMALFYWPLIGGFPNLKPL